MAITLNASELSQRILSVFILFRFHLSVLSMSVCETLRIKVKLEVIMNKNVLNFDDDLII